VKSSLYGAAAEYALHSLLTLAARPDPVSVRDLAAFHGIPERFLAKIFTRLEKARLVKANEGIAGGFTLARPTEQIPVMDALEAIGPRRTVFACAEIRRNCILFGDAPPAWSVSGMCLIHRFMQEAERELRDFLASKSLADLSRDFERKAPLDFVRESDVWFRQRKRERTNRRERK
jgi:Rrf2 family protein